MSKQFSSQELEEIIRRYRPVVGFSVKKALGPNYPDWEDVVQDVLTQVITKLQTGEFRGECSLGTFIYTITKRRIVDCIRQKSKVKVEMTEVATSASGPEESLMKKERAELVSRALFKLKPKFREILYLYYYKELSREEVAARLGLSERQVSERLYYAQKVLSKVLRRFFPEKNSNFSSERRLKE
jgi:RNA polymerase sigma factor (sigma-70 family)